MTASRKKLCTHTNTDRHRHKCTQYGINKTKKYMAHTNTWNPIALHCIALHCNEFKIIRMTAFHSTAHKANQSDLFKQPTKINTKNNSRIQSTGKRTKTEQGVSSKQSSSAVIVLDVAVSIFSSINFHQTYNQANAYQYSKHFQLNRGILRTFV